MKNDISVLVSGASIAGLSMAYWLARYGFKVTVVEVAPTIRPGGQALDVRGPAVTVAEKMGILPEIHKQRSKINGLSVVDSDGKDVFRSEERTLTGGRHETADIEIMRDDLCQVLYQAVDDKVEFLFSESIASISQADAGVDVEFTGGAQRHFDLVIGADGLHSGTRRLILGPEQNFLRFLGLYVAVFAIPNFLGLDHWEIFHQDGEILGGLLVRKKDSPARTYIVFKTDKAIAYDYRDIAAQKQLVAERVARARWEFPRILELMRESPDFHFDSASQVIMDRWSNGRVVLVGDAAFCVSPVVGQGTTVAMVGAYVLAGELAAHRDDPLAGIAAYEHALRDYILVNQENARKHGGLPFAEPDEETGEYSEVHPDGIADFGKCVVPLELKDY